jgi:hypothetical protein
LLSTKNFGRLARLRFGCSDQTECGVAEPSSAIGRLETTYFLSAAFFSAGAVDADFAIDVVGTMMWAHGLPFHIANGPPLVQSGGYASS